jgi:ABC-type phosphate transport system substrate-binding protein
MTRRPGYLVKTLLPAVLVLAPLGAFGVLGTPQAGADTPATSLVGEGGSFLTPVTSLLLTADTSNLGPLNPTYSDSQGIDDAIADFVGTGVGQFGADFAVSERPLTTAEAATATADGRSFAYVPFAATPVAIVTLAVCNPSDLSLNVETPSTFCRNIPLTPELLGDIFTHDLTTTATGIPPTLTGFGDPRFSQAPGSQGCPAAPASCPIPDGDGLDEAFALGPDAENSALMAVLDSDPVAKQELDNALNNPVNEPSTTSDTPNEVWPFHLSHSYVGGDEGLVEKELTINSETNLPEALNSWAGLGGPDGSSAHDAFPVSAVWTGAPLGSPLNLPTADIENADTQFVGPTEAAAKASEADATLDPKTNLVTFTASSTDATAYNNDLMSESYLVVPTSGLATDKATKLAQFIRFILGPTAQTDISTLGAAPATPAMVTAGLKVASELSAEAQVAVAAGSSTTTNTSGSTTGGTSATGSTASTGSGTPTASSSGVDSSAGSGSLAFTGSDPLPLAVLGISMLLLGSLFRRHYLRRSRQRRRHSGLTVWDAIGGIETAVPGARGIESEQ